MATQKIFSNVLQFVKTIMHLQRKTVRQEKKLNFPARTSVCIVYILHGFAWLCVEICIALLICISILVCIVMFISTKCISIHVFNKFNISGGAQ